MHKLDYASSLVSVSVLSLGKSVLRKWEVSTVVLV